MVKHVRCFSIIYYGNFMLAEPADHGVRFHEENYQGRQVIHWKTFFFSVIHKEIKHMQQVIHSY